MFKVYLRAYIKRFSAPLCFFALVFLIGAFFFLFLPAYVIEGKYINPTPVSVFTLTFGEENYSLDPKPFYYLPLISILLALICSVVMTVFIFQDQFKKASLFALFSSILSIIAGVLLLTSFAILKIKMDMGVGIFLPSILLFGSLLFTVPLFLLPYLSKKEK